MKNRKQIALSAALVVVAATVVGFQLQDGGAEADGGMEDHNHAAMGAAAGEQQPVRLSEEDGRRIGVTFATVEERGLERSVEALGTVAYDETSLATVNPRIEGWVETLYVDFTGAPVRAGQAMLAIYSPALVTAQEELVLAMGLLADAAPGRARDNAEALVESAQRRLEYWGIPREEIERVVATGQVSRTLTLRAPASGIVVEKNVVEGDRIMPGMTVYRIADLSTVWVEAEVFEKDLGLVAEGRPATVRFEAFPGQEFNARITYVHPTVSLESRTGRIRLELPNPEGLLKPGMYARIRLEAPALEVAPVVPRSAVLSTGTRSLVFVRSADGTLVPREVTPGRTVGRDVQILEGVRPGEQVVSSAGFLVDAESNLGALTAGMGMGMDGMDTGSGTGEGMEGADHSGHDMGADAAPMDHSGHDMGADTAPMDHSGHDMGADSTSMDHSGHDMGADTTSTDHSAHVMAPDTVAVR
ncbi:MAG TPA: efflux RND transporter periplasmic adaptor subunit [Longimicrobiales bacterium]|nr:efflux RND transporter periplasmic adaptor subunit [Longimicrobiales bacterium]